MAIGLKYGESFIATFSLKYQGPAMAIGLKVALGRIYVAFFDEVETWVGQDSVPLCNSWTAITRELRCTIPAQGQTSLKPGEDYDASAEIGDYPWSDHVYIRKQQADVITIFTVAPPPGAQFDALTVTYKKG